MDKGNTGWVVAVAVALVAVGYYFWPSIMQAPVIEQGTSEQAGDMQMSGLWQSTTDTKFTREIRADGVLVDRYEGDGTSGDGGSWTIVNPLYETPLASRVDSLAGLTVVKVVWGNLADPIDTTYFAVNALDSASMTTTDLSGRGEVTIWKKL